MDSHYYEQQSFKINKKEYLSPTQNNDDTLENYKKLRVIGRGAFGLCSLYQDKTSILNKKVVIKSVSLECRNQSERNSVLCNYFNKF